MQHVNQTQPDRMTPEERRHEAASLLAAGLIRLRQTGSRQCVAAAESKFGLAYCGNQSVHSHPVNSPSEEAS